MKTPAHNPGPEAPPRRAERIGFVGLGRMGHPMARNIAAAGYPLIVYDIRPEVRDRFCAEFGAQPADDIADLAAATVIVTMLPSSREVEAVLLGSEDKAGLAATLPAGTLVLDCSSSDPLVTRRLATELGGLGIRMVDAPVAGGVVFADNGTLDILVAGAPEDMERAEPVLLAMGKQVHRCGAIGAGHAMKLINNFVNAQALITYIEAMAIGAKFGLDMDVMARSLLSATTGRNHPFEKKVLKQIVTGEFASGMALSLISKDVSLTRQLAESLGAWSPVAQMTAELWAQAAREVGPAVDQTEIVRLWEKMIGVELRAELAEARP